MHHFDGTPSTQRTNGLDNEPRRLLQELGPICDRIILQLLEIVGESELGSVQKAIIIMEMILGSNKINICSQINGNVYKNILIIAPKAHLHSSAKYRPRVPWFSLVSAYANLPDF